MHSSQDQHSTPKFIDRLAKTEPRREFFRPYKEFYSGRAHEQHINIYTAHLRTCIWFALTFFNAQCAMLKLIEKCSSVRSPKYAYRRHFFFITQRKWYMIWICYVFKRKFSENGRSCSIGIRNVNTPHVPHYMPTTKVRIVSWRCRARVRAFLK